MKNIWEKLSKAGPIFALAPMHDVTDSAFRSIVAICGRPDIFFTEFVAIDGLTNPQGRKKIEKYYLTYDKKEKPIIAQIWGSDTKKMKESAKIIAGLGFDGIDINMGCPDKRVIKSGGGAGLINNPKLMKELVLVCKNGSKGLPVSVKTRIGFDEISIEKWLPILLEAKPDALTIHARTKKELSKVPPHWDIVKKISPLVKKEGIILIGNGDIKSYNDGLSKIQEYNLDGVMIGRGALGNPWIFNKDVDFNDISIKNKINLMIQHAKIFERNYKDIKKFPHVKKHLHAYIQGFEGAKKLRSQIMLAKNSLEIEKMALDWLKTMKNC